MPCSNSPSPLREEGKQTDSLALVEKSVSHLNPPALLLQGTSVRDSEPSRDIDKRDALESLSAC